MKECIHCGLLIRMFYSSKDHFLIHDATLGEVLSAARLCQVPGHRPASYERDDPAQ